MPFGRCCGQWMAGFVRYGNAKVLLTLGSYVVSVLVASSTLAIPRSRSKAIRHLYVVATFFFP